MKAKEFTVILIKEADMTFQHSSIYIYAG